VKLLSDTMERQGDWIKVDAQEEKLKPGLGPYLLFYCLTGKSIAKVLVFAIA